MKNDHLNNSPSLLLKAIGVVRSPFKEKFGLPRQPGLITSCNGAIDFFEDFQSPDFFQGIEQFSDLWLITGFHEHFDHKASALVRPPRLGGNKKMGVFASRAPFRPNSLSLSRVHLKSVEQKDNRIKLIISCPDMIDGSPVYDIKPYIHYADSNQHARCAYANQAPEKLLLVDFSKEAKEYLAIHRDCLPKNFQSLIEEVLAQDPRPAYKGSTEIKQYGIRLYDYNIIWIFKSGTIMVDRIHEVV